MALATSEGRALGALLEEQAREAREETRWLRRQAEMQRDMLSQLMQRLDAGLPPSGAGGAETLKRTYSITSTSCGAFGYLSGGLSGSRGGVIFGRLVSYRQPAQPPPRSTSAE